MLSECVYEVDRVRDGDNVTLLRQEAGSKVFLFFIQGEQSP